MKALKILVAEDESLIRLGLRNMLLKLGHTVVLAADGREAIKQLHLASPDLALLDIHMPFTDGLEVARTIARKRPLPIIILTAFGEQDLIERAALLPIHGYLIKPVNERDLAAAIEIAVARFEDAQASAREIAELKDSLEARKVVERAKGILMQRGLSEDEAYHTIRRRAREARVSMRQAAESIIAPTKN